MMDAQIVNTERYQAELQRQYNNLPQVLQDLISEYNVMHRTLMEAVLDEFMYVHERDFVPLCGYVECERRLREDAECVRRYIINYEYQFCCEYCASAGTAEIRMYHRHYMRKMAKMNATLNAVN